MNRELKFRIWLKDINHFMYPIGILDLAQIIQNNEDNINNCVIQQFTGLLDKNGKKIYEEDIVTDEIRTYKVNMSDWPGFIMFEGKDFVADCSQITPNENCEIIGNICENPELFK